ncbi:MAG: cAMP-activated global transcriptional regulator CRP [Pseudomonadota bacterium]
MVAVVDIFLKNARRKSVAPRATIIHAGALPDSIFYIVKGTVEVMIEDEQGGEMILGYLSDGQFFGEMGLFNSEHPARSAWVRTRTECTLAEMSYARFKQLSAEHPSLLFEIATQLARRLDRTNRKVTDLAFLDVSGRIAKALMDLCRAPEALSHPDQNGVQIKVSRQELARLVGCSREMAGRVLKGLQEQGLIEVKGMTIVVYNMRNQEPMELTPLARG